MFSTKSDVELKRLGFIRSIAISTVVCVLGLYERALKWTIGTVEGAVMAVVKPVYEIFKRLVDTVFVWLDSLVDKILTKLYELSPTFVKVAISQVKIWIEIAKPIYNIFLTQVRLIGLKAAIHYMVTLYKPIVLPQIALFWYEFQKKPLVHFMAKFAIPIGTRVSEIYNKVIVYMSKKGYSIFGYFVEIPINEMAIAYKVVETAAKAAEQVAALVGGGVGAALNVAGGAVGTGLAVANKVADTAAGGAAVASKVAETAVEGAAAVVEGGATAVLNVADAIVGGGVATASKVADTAVEGTSTALKAADAIVKGGASAATKLAGSVIGGAFNLADSAIGGTFKLG